MIEAEIAQEHSDGERTRSMMAEDYDGLVGVKLGRGARGNLRHGNEGRVGQRSGVELPGFANV